MEKECSTLVVEAKQGVAVSVSCWTIDVDGWLSKRGTCDLHTKSAFKILNQNHSENNHSNTCPEGPKLN